MKNLMNLKSIVKIDGVKMENKTMRQILVIFWGMILCINLVICLYNSSPFGWAIVGFVLGGIFILLLDNPIINLQDKFIKDLLKHIKKSQDLFNEIDKRTIPKNKKLKGGKK